MPIFFLLAKINNARAGGAVQALYLKLTTPLPLKKSFVKKIYGLNLFLSAREARGVAKIQWASVAEAHQKISENELSCVMESIYNTAWTYFNKFNP